jgi:dephospho-CoA kinase
VLRVGLTGGLASGKSTLAALLAGHGAAVRDADELVASLYEPGAAGTQLVADLFGSEMLDAAGAVDRHRLGALVLRDQARRQRLEAAVHPHVRAEIARWLEGSVGPTARRGGARGGAAGGDRFGRDYHRLVVVTAPVEVRRARALTAGWPADAIDLVLGAQASDAEREAVADYLIVNGGDSEDLVAAADRLWAALSRDATLLASAGPSSFGRPSP